jgi:hypothetical protein
MIPSELSKDLIVLAADKSMKRDLGIRPIACDVFPHRNNDPGVFKESHNFLRPQCRRYRYAVTICDRKGCGREILARDQLEKAIEQRLHANGWENRAVAIVIDLELEAWIWGDWNTLATLIRWTGGGASLKSFLIERQFLRHDQGKPPRPKEALEETLKHVQVRFSSAIHQSMAQQAQFAQCVDPAFLKMLATLQARFPSK